MILVLILIIMKFVHQFLGVVLVLCVLPVNTYAQVDREPYSWEQKELKKFDSFSGFVNVIATNPDGAFHDFLARNVDKTVFIAISYVRYEWLPPHITAENREKAPPSDRFENEVVRKCWGDAIYDLRPLARSGKFGIPLPLDEADVDMGCKYRIKFNLDETVEFLYVRVFTGMDKEQVLVGGFYRVRSKTYKGRIFYKLNQVNQDRKTIEAYYRHSTKRVEFQPLWLEDHPESSSASGLLSDVE